MSSMPLPSYLTDHELLTSVYHGWPSFHDAEIISIFFDRSGIIFGPIYNPRIELVVHCLDMSADATEEPSARVRHTLVHFGFEEVSDVILEGFNHQNPISGLSFEPVPTTGPGATRFKVVIDPVHETNLRGQFLARVGKVISVRKCNETGGIEPVSS